MRKRRFQLVVVTAGLAMVAWSLAGYCGETRISCNNLPAAVQKAAEAEKAGATVRGCSKERENGRMQYELQLMKDGKSRDITFLESGAVAEVEQQVDRSDLPAAVSAALDKAAAGKEVSKVESLSRDGALARYEAVVKTAGGKHEVAFLPDGKQVKPD